MLISLVLQGPPYVFATLILNAHTQPPEDASANFIPDSNYSMSRLSNEVQFLPQFNQKMVKRVKTGHPGVCTHEDICDQETNEYFYTFSDFKLQNHNFSVTSTTEFLLEICFMAAASKKTMKNSNF